MGAGNTSSEWYSKSRTPALRESPSAPGGQPHRPDGRRISCKRLARRATSSIAIAMNACRFLPTIERARIAL